MKRSSRIVAALAACALAGCSAQELQQLDGLKIGDPAPRFTLSDQNGVVRSLDEFLGQGPVVLYFYPKDDTPGCTAEACGFRDSYEAFLEAGAEVIGVSGDSAASHREFAARHQLPFVLLCDEEGAVRGLYHVPSTLGIPGRVTFVLDRGGAIRLIFSAMLSPERHIEEALRVVQGLGG